MKKMLMAIALSVAALSAIAEPSFDQMQTLIEQHQYAAAEQGLEVILQAHPTSAKAFYSMAQAQAGLGHLDKAALALDKAQGLDPELNFASERQVKDLRSAITPQVAKIDRIEESHFWRNLFIVLGLGGFLACIIYFARQVKKAPLAPEENRYSPYAPSPSPEVEAEVRSTVKADYKPDPERVASVPHISAKESYYDHRPRYTAPPVAPTPMPAQPAVVNNHYGSSNDGLVTGMLLGNMMSSGHHDHTTIIERDVIVERPSYSAPAVVAKSDWDEPVRSTPSRSSSWDDTPSTPSRSSSWDDDSSSRSSSSSSSWSSSDSSSSSSSWDSGSSSSSDSGSSSSWDS